jgi:outer membrane protein assembly factor BamD
MFYADVSTANNWRRWSFALVAAALLAAPLLLSGCAGKSKSDEDLNPNVAEQPVEDLYNGAYKLMTQKRYEEAAKGFDEVERQHPYSVWARRAMLMSAFSYYQANKYDDAVDSADRFLSLHPGNRDAPYAYYLKAICYYEQISDVGRDQEKTLQALNALQDIVRRYPGTEYARDAHLKIDLTRDHLAGKEMYIGRYYLNHAQFVAAINRFKSVVETYQTTSHVPEALERMTEAYFALGLNDEAQASAAVLGYNFPDSTWYKYSYDLLTKRGLSSGAAKPMPASIRRVETPKPSPAGALAPPSDAGTVEEAPEAKPAAPQAKPAKPKAPTTVAPTEPSETPTEPSGTPMVSAPSAPTSPQTVAAASSPSPPVAQQTATEPATPTAPSVVDVSADAAPPVAQGEQPLRNVPLIDRPYTDEDLKDSWVRRLVRGIF